MHVYYISSSGQASDTIVSNTWLGKMTIYSPKKLHLLHLYSTSNVERWGWHIFDSSLRIFPIRVSLYRCFWKYCWYECQVWRRRIKKILYYSQCRHLVDLDGINNSISINSPSIELHHFPPSYRFVVKFYMIYWYFYQNNGFSSDFAVWLWGSRMLTPWSC